MRTAHGTESEDGSLEQRTGQVWAGDYHQPATQKELRSFEQKADKAIKAEGKRAAREAKGKR